jgi:hypothetical protein
MRDIRVLVACEYSGVVRDAFTKAGCYAISCDLLPSESPGEHYQGDVLDILNADFDLLVAHPPCTYLSSAFGSYADHPYRVLKRLEAAAFFMKLYNADIPHICVENPRGVMPSIFRKWDQEVHPYFFGDAWRKRTCFWFKDLPALINYDLYVEPNYSLMDVAHTGHARSRFSPAMAKAMAKQWVPYIAGYAG